MNLITLKLAECQHYLLEDLIMMLTYGILETQDVGYT